MVNIIFIGADGSTQTQAQGEVGQSLLSLAQVHSQPLEGTCEGSMACSTCHVIIDAEDFAKLPKPSEEEEDMLDMASSVTRTSRLACQIMLSPELEGMRVHMPHSVRNMQKYR
jgi:ferredoxin-2, mitochondrial